MKKVRTVLALLIVLGFISTLVGGVGYVYGNPDGVTDNFDNENYIASKTNLVVIGGQVRLAQDCSSYGCAEPDGLGGCIAKAAGDYDLPACKKCDGASLSPVNIADNTRDTEGSNLCNQTCKKCSSGSCVNQGSSEDLFAHCGTTGCYTGNCNGSGACGYYTSGDGNCPVCQTCVGATSSSCLNYANASQDTTEPGTCTATHYRCNGSGSCTAPWSLVCKTVGGNCNIICLPDECIKCGYTCSTGSATWTSCTGSCPSNRPCLCRHYTYD